MNLDGHENEYTTINEILIFAKGYLKKHGVESGDVDARVLFAHVFEMPMTRLLVSMRDDVRMDRRYRKFTELIRKRANGCPTAYLTGVKEFHSLEFGVDEYTLIPRPDSEVLVDTVLYYIKAEVLKSSVKILDIGTGCGCLGVAIAKKAARAHVTMTDINLGALAAAAANAIRHGIEERVGIIKSDLFAEVKGVFDIIISNPPYIKTGDIEKLPAHIREYEPITALDGGKDGLAFYRRMVPSLREHLKPGGAVFFEVGQGQAREAAALLRENGFRDKSVTFVKDLNGAERVVWAVI
jgi:release factor glutamine methyltransferase